MRHAGAGDGRKVEAPANVFHGDAVEKNLIGVGVASANKDRGDAAALSGLHDVESGNLTQRIDHVGAVMKSVLVKTETDALTWACGCGRTCGGDDDGLAHPFRLKNDVLLDGIELSAIETSGC